MRELVWSESIRKTMALTLGVIIIGAAGACGALGYRVYEIESSSRSATQYASAVVVDIGSTKASFVEVRWADSRERKHTGLLYDLVDWERFRIGDRIEIRYDPSDPAGFVFAGRNLELKPIAQAEWVGVSLFGVLYLSMLWLLVARGLGSRAPARAEPIDCKISPLLGIVSGKFGTEWRSSWIAIQPVAEGQDLDLASELPLQRIFWTEEIERVAADTRARVRIARGRAVVELPDGTIFWPAGALRAKPSWGCTLTRRQANAAHDVRRSGPPLPVVLIGVPLVGIAGLAWGGVLVAGGLAFTGIAIGYFWWAWEGGDRSAGL